MMNQEIEIPKVYDPHQVETSRYEWWNKNGYFEATIADDGRPRYCITIPPPNITGSLHLGHALNHSIHDALLRWKRMSGYNVLCVPGTDHAGIGTENVVNRQLKSEGLSRVNLGREKYIERVWQWREQYGNTILMQFRRLGCSYDWRYTRFTLDPEYVDAVMEEFVRWWQDGHLYIGERVVNWCPGCRTTISDIETTEKEGGEPGKLYHIRYPFEDGSGHVVVATTRPETMLGDVAVAIHPKDERYHGLTGKKLRLPLVGRLIPLIADEYPNPEFGSGAVKITPAHDPDDFEVGQRHKLPSPVILNDDATLNTERLREALDAHDNLFLQRYNGMDRYEARKAILADLEEYDFIEKIEDYSVPLSRCERCDSVIEPLLSEQWFCRMKQIAEPAIQAVHEGKVRFVPERYREIYLNWMENIRDWNIARQLWWGHQIPAWYCIDCHPHNFEITETGIRIKKRENPIVQKETPSACPRCSSSNLVRDPDVLDTWFSSAIWPQTVLGWHRETEELKLFYPTDTLLTAQEIIFLWVARMIMTGLYFVNEIPFHDVYIHATVLNKEGRRMSKSLGTGIDPLEMIKEYGADALRWSLLQQAGLQQSFRFYQERVVSARNFANKLWNASRFVLMNLDESREPEPRIPSPELRNAIDRWILSRLQHTIRTVNEAIACYRFDEGASALYEFIWNEVCDWYIEAVKSRLQDPVERPIVQGMLVYLFDRWLRLLHPYMPHITEEIWQAMPHEGQTLTLAAFPQYHPEWVDSAAEVEIEHLFETIRAIRNLRAEVKITPGVNIKEVYLNANSGAEGEAGSRLQAHENLIRSLAWCEQVHWQKPPAGSKFLADVWEGVEIFLPIAGVIDLEKECDRLKTEITKLEEDIRRVQGRLRNPQFMERAKPDVVQETRDQERSLLDRHMLLMERVKHLQCP
jgi:valyl-tRNA synthetase